MSHSTDNTAGGVHIASIAHDGRLWTVFAEFQDDARRPESYRACLRFDPADGVGADDSVRTAVILIEPTFEAAVNKARGFDERQLASLLRSILPDPT